MFYGKNNELKKYIKQEKPLKLRANNNKIIHLDIFKDIIQKTSNNYSDKARCYLYIMEKYNNICDNEDCNNETKFDNEKNLFRQFCSIQCRNRSIKMRKQISDKWDNNLKQQKVKKSKETCLERYGVENPMQLQSVQSKSKKTCLERYGVEYIWQSKEVRDKVIQTTIKRTGVDNINQKHFTNFKQWNDVEFITKTFIKEQKVMITEMSKYFNCHEGTIYKHLKKLNIKYKTTKGSVYEQEIVEYIKSLNVNVIQNDRSIIGDELDVLCPDQKIAIEFNGLYWHSYGLNNVNIRQSDLKYNKKRHQIKTFDTKLKDIQLFHIFENEWVNSNLQQIWKSQISNALHLNKKVIGARKCEIREVDSSDASNFLKENHLQGKCQASINIALIYNNEIISLMTFGKSRYDKNIDFELIRFCSKLFTQVPGAASKLLKYFEKTYNPQGLVSYANARWSNGHLYKTLNFIDAGYSQPNYFYYKESDKTKLYSRVKFQKHKLPKLLDMFDINKTEMQNMIENKYRVIYDAGNYKYIKIYKQNI